MKKLLIIAFIPVIFSCKTNDRSVVDPSFLPGQIIHDPNNPTRLVYNRDSDKDGQLDPFFLCGPGDPEGFLFRGERNNDGTREGDQMELINKLIAYGGNSIYLMAVRTHGGDAWKDNRDEPDIYPDALHNPWNGQDPHASLNHNILDQWDEWFTLMDRHGITIYFFFYDDAINIGNSLGWPLDEKGELHPGEKKFVQDLVNRFKHHRHLIWCVMEEGQEIGRDWRQHVSKIAEAIREADEYNHIIASHQHGGNVFFHKHDPFINQFALQTNMNQVESYDDYYKWMVDAWKNSEGMYSIVMSEDYFQGNHSVPLNDRRDFRIRCWIPSMAGAYVMTLRTDIANTPEEWLGDLRIIQRFIEATTFNQMNPLPELASGETKCIMGIPGFDYILYSYKCEQSLAIKNMEKGTYVLKWMDCANGKEVIVKNSKVEGGDLILRKPKDFGDEVALFIKRTDKKPVIQPIRNKKVEELVAGRNKAPFIEDVSYRLQKSNQINVQLRYVDEDGGPGPYKIEIVDKPENGLLEGIGNDLVYIPNSGFKGRDVIRWKVHDGQAYSNLGIVEIEVR
jgi:hypothetical protein